MSAAKKDRRSVSLSGGSADLVLFLGRYRNWHGGEHVRADGVCLEFLRRDGHHARCAANAVTFAVFAGAFSLCTAAFAVFAARAVFTAGADRAGAVFAAGFRHLDVDFAGLEFRVGVGVIDEAVAVNGCTEVAVVLNGSGGSADYADAQHCGQRQDECENFGKMFFQKNQSPFSEVQLVILLHFAKK